MNAVPTLPDHIIAENYRRTYHLGSEIGAKEAKLHWTLERRLTEEILASTPATRWEVSSRAYTELYASLPWLNEHESIERFPDHLHQWARLIPPQSSIFEVGSGKATLLRYLHSLGHYCVATEITKERGEKHARDERLIWHTTDGIHLADSEPAQAYDFVLSNQVIEHLHPDDISTHFSHAARILKPGGTYMLTTPHAGAGPSDLSRIFGLEQPVCMHLREYDFNDLGQLLRNASFRSVRAVFPPSRLYRRIGFTFASRSYYEYLCAWDRIDHALNFSPRRRRQFRKALKYLCVPDNIWLSAAT